MEAKVKWIEISFDWWKFAVRVHGLEPVLLGQYGQTALAVATLGGK